MEEEYREAIEFLNKCNNVYILTHQSPDGDTLGSGFALMNALRKLGKNANVLCTEQFPHRYCFMYDGYYKEDFEPETIIAVDVADQQLLGKHLERFAESVDLCIDHHISNTFYAKKTLVNPRASATCEVLFELFSRMNILDTQIATCLYTGIATDTGCFKYESTTSRTHIAASELMAYDFDYAQINRRMFDVKSKGRIQVEQYLSSHMEYFLNDRCSMITITQAIIDGSGMEAAEFEGLASLTLQVEGVEVGVTIKEREKDVYKVS
ncbi:MAG: DHH family phosphoesterase, partial [Oscillospiraceae bacterium]